MTFLKNIVFTHLIKINGSLKEFNFRKSNAGSSAVFTVDTIDRNGTRIVFHMQSNGNTWKILEQDVPLWIMDEEDALHSSIEKELSVQEVYFVKPHNPYSSTRRISRFFHLLGIN